MDNYCKGWSARDGLCIPQFVKLITNAIVVAVAIVCFYLFNVTAKKLVRFRGHDLQYTCICLNVFAIIFEIIVWHTLYGSQGFIILNSVYQMFGILAIGMLYAAGERAARTSSILIIFLFLLSYITAYILEVVMLVDIHEENYESDWKIKEVDVRLILSCIRIVFCSLMLFVSLINLIRGQEIWVIVAERETCNKHWTAALPSRLTFAWMRGLLVKGWKKPLNLTDIGAPPKVDECGPLAKEFDVLWAEELKKPSPSLIMVCLRLFKVTYFSSVVLMVIGDAMIFLSPFAVSGLNRFIEKSQTPSTEDALEDDVIVKALSISDFASNGYVLCFVLFLSGSCRSILSQRYASFMSFWRASHIRALLQFKIFEKSLHLASWANKDPDLTQGKILNVMSTDTMQFHFLFYFVNFAVSAPLMIIAAIVLLVINIGWPALIGILILFASFPINGFLARKMGELQRQMMFAKDKRLKVMNEMLLGIKSIKMYNWAPLFEKMIIGARKEEIKILKKQQLYRAVFIFIANILPTLMACSIFVVYSSTSPVDPETGKRQPLTTPLALLTLALLSILKMPFILIPFAVGSFVAGRACGHRITKFLQAPEVPFIADSEFPDNDTAVEFKDATLSWDVAMDAPTILRDVSLKIPRSKLTIVVGEVGSGKTAIINAVLHEMHVQSGEIIRNIKSDKISYASQNPWILNSTVKENILFGQPLDEKRYKEVCAATCLDLDLKILAAGDQTEIGERGINLSGGQRQRVSVARALYMHSDLVLLDDPLSALDAHVGAKLFERGIKQFLKNSERTVILITHHLQYLKDADLVVELEDGRVSYSGHHSQYVQESKFYKNFIDNLADKNGAEEEILDDASDPKRLRESTSIISRQTTMESEKEVSKEKGGLMTEEERETGSVKMQVYMTWAKAAGPGLIFSLAVLLLAQLSRIAVDYWIITWSEKQIPEWQDDTYYITTYICMALAAALCILVGNVTLVFDGLRASHKLFSDMLDRIIRATPRFFDTTPLGRIISRFSNDITNIDTKLLENINSAYNLTTRVLCVIVTQVVASYYFGIAIIPVFLIYYLVQQIYITTSREIQRLDSITKSPIMALFSESLGGLSTIRAYLKLPSFSTRMEKNIDANTNTFLLVNMASNWVGFRLDLIGVLITTMSGLVCVVAATQKDANGEFIISPAEAGLALTFALALPAELNWMLRNVSFMELYMNAVERVNTYATVVPVEQDDGSLDPPSSWPPAGEIVFDDYSGAYDTELDNVLHNISLTIPAGKRVGICGRTGSGKSSLTIAMFRLLCCKGGSIKIDDVSTNDLTLKRLRETLTIIPQDPLLFAGTLRYNLDPASNVDDAKVWGALERVNMKTHVKTMDKGLDSDITGSGENFSVGQRQLLCLARAFLRNSKIIIMDEATASIDMETDEKIQKVIRSEFLGRTMLVIAHRISSIADSDLILVMDKGKVAEYDTPQVLCSDKMSLFSSLLTSNVL